MVAGPTFQFRHCHLDIFFCSDHIYLLERAGSHIANLRLEKVMNKYSIFFSFDLPLIPQTFSVVSSLPLHMNSFSSPGSQSTMQATFFNCLWFTISLGFIGSRLFAFSKSSAASGYLLRALSEKALRKNAWAFFGFFLITTLKSSTALSWYSII